MPNQRQSFVFSSKKHQQGISLIVILVVVMLAMLLALWAARSALFNQIIVSNDADYQRAFSAAQAMLQDAELDILRMQPNGNNCVKNSSKPQVCRTSGDGRSRRQRITRNRKLWQGRHRKWVPL